MPLKQDCCFECCGFALNFQLVVAFENSHGAIGSDNCRKLPGENPTMPARAASRKNPLLVGRAKNMDYIVCGFLTQIHGYPSWLWRRKLPILPKGARSCSVCISRQAFQWAHMGFLSHWWPVDWCAKLVVIIPASPKWGELGSVHRDMSAKKKGCVSPSC